MPKLTPEDIEKYNSDAFKGWNEDWTAWKDAYGADAPYPYQDHHPELFVDHKGLPEGLSKETLKAYAAHIDAQIFPKTSAYIVTDHEGKHFYYDPQAAHNNPFVPWPKQGSLALGKWDTGGTFIIEELPKSKPALHARYWWKRHTFKELRVKKELPKPVSEVWSIGNRISKWHGFTLDNIS